MLKKYMNISYIWDKNPNVNFHQTIIGEVPGFKNILSELTKVSQLISNVNPIVNSINFLAPVSYGNSRIYGLNTASEGSSS